MCIFIAEKWENNERGILFACFLLITGNLFRNDLLVVRERRAPKKDFSNVAYIIANIYGIFHTIYVLCIQCTRFRNSFFSWTIKKSVSNGIRMKWKLFKGINARALIRTISFIERTSFMGDLTWREKKKQYKKEINEKQSKS